MKNAPHPATRTLGGLAILLLSALAAPPTAALPIQDYIFAEIEGNAPHVEAEDVPIHIYREGNNLIICITRPQPGSIWREPDIGEGDVMIYVTMVAVTGDPDEQLIEGVPIAGGTIGVGRRASGTCPDALVAP